MACAWGGFYGSSQLRRWMQHIPRRFSCRDFSGPAQIAQKTALHYAAARVCLPHTRIVVMDCPSPDMFYPIPFVSSIAGAQHYAAVIADMAHKDAALWAGISGEAFVLEATSLQLGTCWVAANYRRRDVEVPLEGQEKVLAVLALGMPRDPDGVSNRRRKALNLLCRDDPAKWPLWAYQAAEAVRAAPSAMNLQPWRFSCASNTMQISMTRRNVDAGIAILHAECALHDIAHTWREGTKRTDFLISNTEEYDVPI